MKTQNGKTYAYFINRLITLKTNIFLHSVNEIIMNLKVVQSNITHLHEGKIKLFKPFIKVKCILL